MDKVIEFFKTLKLLDDDGTLNLSGLLFLVVIVKLGNEQIDWPLVAAMLLTLSNYNLKKFFRISGFKKNDLLEARMKTMEADIKSLMAVTEMRKLGR